MTTRAPLSALLFTVLALSACSAPGVVDVTATPAPLQSLHERLLSPTELNPSGWIPAESMPDVTRTFTADPTATACDGATTARDIGELPGLVATHAARIELPDRAFAVDVVIFTAFTTEWRTQVFAHAADDTLLTVTLLYPSVDASEYVELIRDAIGSARAPRRATTGGGGV